jgi:1-acyl-sn-glycerol-3-phosphate acyltransferase
MSKVENFKNPIIRMLMQQLGSFPVERGSTDRGALQHALTVLAAGEILGMFPEGTRTHGNGLTEAKTGTAHLAMRANTPIIPVVLYGTEKILNNPFKKAKVTLKVLPAIWALQHEKAIDLTTRLMKLIAAELPVSQRGIYSN